MTAFKNKIWLGTAAAAITIPLMALPAAAATTCVTAPVSTYTAAGFSCSLDGVTFSQMAINTTLAGGGTVTLGNITPMISGTEAILSLNYVAMASGGQTADIAWTYVVTANPGFLINDALASLSATDTGSGTSSVGETLSPNGVTLTLIGAGSVGPVTFAPIASLSVLKDQLNAGLTGMADASILQNGFSTVSIIPIPGALPLFAGGLAGLCVLARKRKKQKVDAAIA